MDKNIVMLEGLIGDDYKYGKTQECKEFATFSLCINCFLKEFADSTERTHSQQFIRIFIYDKKQLDYLKRVKARRGQRASVFGRICSSKSEYKGITYISNSVVARDVTIIKTKRIKQESSNNKNEQEQEHE